MKEKKQGGARPGSGPKPKYDSPLVSLTMTVPSNHKEEIRKKFREILDAYKLPSNK